MQNSLPERHVVRDVAYCRRLNRLRGTLGRRRVVRLFDHRWRWGHRGGRNRRVLPEFVLFSQGQEEMRHLGYQGWRVHSHSPRDGGGTLVGYRGSALGSHDGRYGLREDHGGSGGVLGGNGRCRCSRRQEQGWRGLAFGSRVWSLTQFFHDSSF